MNKVQRYSQQFRDYGIVEDEYGEYCKYSELAAMKQRAEAAEARINDFERRCEAGYNKLDWLDANERVLELEERIKKSQEHRNVEGGEDMRFLHED